MRVASTVVACLLATTPARAQPDVAVAAIPGDCIAYVSTDMTEDLLWGQVLSLAACIQDATVANITSSEELVPTVDMLARALGPSTMLYVYAIEHGPLSTQLRATYQIGMAFVGLTTRARASIQMAPPGDPAALARYLALHAQLEPILASATRTARIAFTLVVQAVRDDPALEADAVASYMIHDARLKLEQLGGPPSPDEVRIAAAAR